MELKPCPFCGGTAKIKHQESEDECAIVGCSNRACGINLYRSSVPEAVACWNKRIAEPPEKNPYQVMVIGGTDKAMQSLLVKELLRFTQERGFLILTVMPRKDGTTVFTYKHKDEIKGTERNHDQDQAR